MPNTRIVIADDHALIRDGLRQTFADMEETEVVAEAAHGIEAIAAVKTHQPDLLLLDIAMPYAGGLELIGEIRQWSPGTRIAVLTGIATTGIINELMDASVDGILLKSCPTEELLRGLAELASGNTFVCDEARRLHANSGVFAQLTTRERQVLHQLVSGASNSDIADRFNISPKTVDNHRTNLMRKLDVHSLPALIQVALREGLMPDSQGAGEP